MAIGALLLVLGGPACRQNVTPEQREALLQKGDDALLGGRIHEAEEAFGAATRAPDAGGRAWSGLGLAQLRSGEVAEALASFEKALALDPNNVDYAFLRAHALQTGGHDKEALEAYQAIEKTHPGKPEVETQLIELLDASGKTDEARRLALESADRSPGDFDLVMSAARLLQKSGAHESSIVYYQRARTIRPYSLDALYGMIEAYRDAGQVQQSRDLIDTYHELEARTKAVDALRRQAAANPDDAAAARRYVERLYDEGWLDVAISETGTFLKQFPDDSARGALALRAARAAVSVRDFATAARFYAIAKESLPGDETDLKALAGVATALGEWEDAAGFWRTYLDDHPDDREALETLGRTLMRANKLEDAEAPLRRAIELFPKDATAHADLGLLLVKREEEAPARSELNRALALDPDHADALFGLGLLAQQKKDFVTAEKRLKETLEKAPDNQDALVVLALVLSDQRKCEEAVPLFTRALQHDYQNMTIHAGLVRCLEQLGRMEEAEKARRVAQELLGQSEPPDGAPLSSPNE